MLLVLVPFVGLYSLHFQGRIFVWFHYPFVIASQFCLFLFGFFIPTMLLLPLLPTQKNELFFFFVKRCGFNPSMFSTLNMFSCYEIKNEHYYIGLFGAARDSQDTRIGSFRILGGARLFSWLFYKHHINLLVSKIYRLV